MSTKDGVYVGLERLDAEQVERGVNRAFWNLIAERRTQPTLSRAELERSLQD